MSIDLAYVYGNVFLKLIVFLTLLTVAGMVVWVTKPTLSSSVSDWMHWASAQDDDHNW